MLADWWPVHSARSAEVVALAAGPSPRTVVWLNELQRYDRGEQQAAGAQPGLRRKVLALRLGEVAALQVRRGRQQGASEPRRARRSRSDQPAAAARGGAGHDGPGYASAAGPGGRCGSRCSTAIGSSRTR
jgi:hypothetical protein